MKISCIYRIVSRLSHDKFYIGSAVDYCRRKNGHLLGLKNGDHCNQLLRKYANKYGSENLGFEILERVYDKSKLIEREQFYIDNWNPYFNICKIAGSNFGIKRSAETLRKMSKSRSGIWHTPEAKLKMSIAHRGRKQSDETLIKRSLAMTGKELLIKAENKPKK